ncbi:MAG: hypothetical protein ABIH56_00010 [Candidatus Margulisiibacteriota bacterium]
MKKLFLVFLALLLIVSFAEAARHKYITSRKNIPVPKTESVRPYVKPTTGKVVKPYLRAPKGSLKPYYKY